MKAICILILSFLLFSCSETTKPSDSNGDFFIKVKLRDSAGNPLSGYKVYIIAQYTFHWGNLNNRPETTFSFCLENSYRVELKIFDYFDNPIKTLINEQLESGTYHINWYLNFSDENERIRDGVYKAVIKYFDDSEEVFHDVFYSYLLAEIDLPLSPYLITDSQGETYQGDIIPFPALYCTDDIVWHDEYCNQIGFYPLSNQTNIIIYDESGFAKIHQFDIVNGANNLVLNWDELEEYEYNDKSINFTENEPTYQDMKDPPIPPNSFVGNYPNPFN